MSEPSKAHVRLVPRVKSPVAPAPVKPPPPPPPPPPSSSSSFNEHDAITRRVVLSPDEPDSVRDSMEMTAVRPPSSVNLDEPLDVTLQRARARSAGDRADEDGANPMDPDGDGGETIALPARQARASGAAVRPGLVDARKRLVTAGAGRTRPQSHTPDPHRRRK